MNIKEIYYFGSFNPFHEGHKLVALCVSDHFYGCKVHITPSPCSPFKKKKDMLPIETRIEIINAMIENHKALDVSTIDAEVGGNYSYQTLEVIKERYDGDSKEIGFLIGSDTLAIFDKWKNWEWIMDNFTVIVYPRVGDNIDELLTKYPKAVLGAAYNEKQPYVYFEYSSTQIRALLENFDENYKYLSLMYNNKTLNILKRIYNEQ